MKITVVPRAWRQEVCDWCSCWIEDVYERVTGPNETVFCSAECREIYLQEILGELS